MRIGRPIGAEGLGIEEVRRPKSVVTRRSSLPSSLGVARACSANGLRMMWQLRALGPRGAAASHSGLRRECHALFCEGAHARFCRESAPPSVCDVDVSETTSNESSETSSDATSKTSRPSRTSETSSRTAVASHSGLRRECHALLCKGAQARFCRESAPHPLCATFACRKRRRRERNERHAVGSDAGGKHDVGGRPARHLRQAGQACGIAEPPQAQRSGPARRREPSSPAPTERREPSSRRYVQTVTIITNVGDKLRRYVQNVTTITNVGDQLAASLNRRKPSSRDQQNAESQAHRHQRDAGSQAHDATSDGSSHVLAAR